MFKYFVTQVASRSKHRNTEAIVSFYTSLTNFKNTKSSLKIFSLYYYNLYFTFIIDHYIIFDV